MRVITPNSNKEKCSVRLNFNLKCSEFFKQKKMCMYRKNPYTHCTCTQRHHFSFSTCKNMLDLIQQSWANKKLKYLINFSSIFHVFSILQILFHTNPLCRGATPTQWMEIWGLFYMLHGRCEKQGTEADLAITEKSETRAEIFVY